MDFVDSLAREVGWTRREVLDSLNELESHNVITPLLKDHGVVGVWLNAVSKAVTLD